MQNFLVVVAVNEPLIAGLYENNELKNEFKIFGHTSAALNELFGQIKDAKIQKIFYAKGPGRFSAIKASHIFLNTWAIVKNIEILSAPSFYFNANAPIHAFAKKYFVLEDSQILLKDFENLNSEIAPFALPKSLDFSEFSDSNNPLYILPAV